MSNLQVFASIVIGADGVKFVDRVGLAADASSADLFEEEGDGSETRH